MNGNTFWAPPNIKTAYHRDSTKAKLFRWKGGRVTEISNDTSSIGSVYRAATVFTQYPDTHHLLAVEFDAETKNVYEEPGGWKVLSFKHIHGPGTQNTWRSSIALFGDAQQLAAPGSSQWMPQLVPKIYDYDPGQATTIPRSAGLVGNLPILFALPAFSAMPDMLSAVLTWHLRPNTWVPHGWVHGCEKHRGMIVTVYLDPANSKTSTNFLLDRLEAGEWGPFYQP
ncbi:MAG: hypothetical protein Q9173_006908 [Seirophora scorigena]